MCMHILIVNTKHISIAHDFVDLGLILFNFLMCVVSSINLYREKIHLLTILTALRVTSILSFSFVVIHRLFILIVQCIIQSLVKLIKMQSGFLLLLEISQHYCTCLKVTNLIFLILRLYICSSYRERRD